MIPIGRVHQIVRYPVKSMAGTAVESSALGWYGLAGDRRFALRRVGDDSGMPWLTASRLPELILYHPGGFDEGTGEPVPAHVRTPSGAQVALHDPALVAEIGARFGGPIELLRLRHGIFDEAPVSVITLATIAHVAEETGRALDPRRFRANIVVDTEHGEPLAEDAWVGRTLVLGDGDPRATLGVTMRDERCAMVNLDPETAERDARVMKTIVRLHANELGVYATVLGMGSVRVGDRVYLAP